MAAIQKRKNSWRAQVERMGIRKSMSFPTKAEALRWATCIEAELLAGPPAPIKRAPVKRASRPKFYPTPTVDNLLSIEEIVAASSPYCAVVGVYFLIQDNELIYIGQSTDVHGRISQHRKDGKPFDRFYIIECPVEMLSLTESKYILMFQPPLNGALSYPRGSVEFA
ncbi:GIY-YIG nuclease family protein [Paraburkholderia tropica]|uniref:GIY-YIG nuclease family protein n=1 Tax=Paraburkholderia tropica TaxID=92647 RepID=UPI002AB5EA74|nr:GIY-YIG nuclease family protein [Paraburkholderia tropica]